MSTTTPDEIPKAVPRTTFAVLRAAPGTVSSSSIVRGISPPKSVRIFRAAPITDFDLLLKAHQAGIEKGLKLKVGNVFTEDVFYNEHAQHEKWAQYGVLAVEMEAAALYTLAAKFGRQALAILTVSDHILTGEATSSDERQTTFNDMIIVALEAAIQE